MTTPPPAPKQYRLRADQLRPLAERRGWCIASDLVTVDGYPVGYMYREEPDDDGDSGWRFLAGHESQAYVDDAAHHERYDVNTIANYDPDIVGWLDAPAGAGFAREGKGAALVQVQGPRWQPGDPPWRRRRPWPPPGVPLALGEHRLTGGWTIRLPERFARRVDDGSLVLWRPGLTIWMNAWGNEQGASREDRLRAIRTRTTAARRDEDLREAGGVTRYLYRVPPDDGAAAPVETLTAYLVADDGHLQVAIRFDDPAEAAHARALVDAIAHRG